MADQHDFLAQIESLQGGRDARGATAHIVDRGEVGVLQQQGAGFNLGPGAVIHDLAQVQDLDMGVFVAQDVAKAHFPFLMPTVGQGAGE